MSLVLMLMGVSGRKFLKEYAIRLMISI